MLSARLFRPWKDDADRARVVALDATFAQLAHQDRRHAVLTARLVRARDVLQLYGVNPPAIDVERIEERSLTSFCSSAMDEIGR
jgi:hypothetical protein